MQMLSDDNGKSGEKNAHTHNHWITHATRMTTCVMGKYANCDNFTYSNESIRGCCCWPIFVVCERWLLRWRSIWMKRKCNEKSVPVLEIHFQLKLIPSSRIWTDTFDIISVHAMVIAFSLIRPFNNLIAKHEKCFRICCLLWNIHIPKINSKPLMPSSVIGWTTAAIFYFVRCIFCRLRACRLCLTAFR